MATNCRLLGLQSGNGTLTTSSLLSSAASGSSFVAFASFDGGTSVTNLTDTKGNSYSRVSTGAAVAARVEAYVCQGGVGGSSHTATFTFGGSSFGTAYLIEVPNAGAGSLDIQVLDGDSSSPYGLPTGTLAQANEEIVLIFGSGSMVSGPYSASNVDILAREENDSLYWPSMVAATTVASTASFTPSITGGSGSGALIELSFKISGGGGGSPDPLIGRRIYILP